jgi:hypothetical protein
MHHGLMVGIETCHPVGQGSNPGQGAIFFLHFFYSSRGLPDDFKYFLRISTGLKKLPKLQKVIL